jgi:coenzyme F420-0:L-glutamate ligase / coenzyme F420-1:gamma-L-glutamate ligase
VTDLRMPRPPSSAGLTVLPVVGVGEVTAGADLAGLLVDAVSASGSALRAGDCLVVSSKVVSKALGLSWPGSREDAVAAGTVRVVAERRAAGDAGFTRVVESTAGPVMAAAGVDASNTGPSVELLRLPDDPDAEAARLRAAVLERLELPSETPLAVVLSDTAGRPWRDGLTDFALGSAGLSVLEDLRGATDHDGRPLAVTMRALADEVAAAADLVKGKADGIPAALVRGLPDEWFSADAPGARALVRVGRGDWFALGSAEAVRAALGVEAGSAASEEVGIRSVLPDEPLPTRMGRVLALALREVPEGSADVGPGEREGTTEVTLGAPDDYDLGRLVVRLEVAAASEGLTAHVAGRGGTTVTVVLR